MGEYNFNLDNKLLYGLDHEFDEAKFQKDWPTDYLKVMRQFILYFDFQFRPSEKIYSTLVQEETIIQRQEVLILDE